MTIESHEGEYLTYAVLEGVDDAKRLQATWRAGGDVLHFHIEGDLGRTVPVRNADDVEAFGRYLMQVIAPTMRKMTDR